MKNANRKYRGIKRGKSGTGLVGTKKRVLEITKKITKQKKKNPA